MLCERSPGKPMPMRMWVLCMWTVIFFGVSILLITCEAAPAHIRIRLDAIQPDMILPAVEDACAEGALYAPIFMQERHCPELSLSKLQVSFALPSLASPWGHILTTDMTVGRQRIRWGPGVTGRLLLSDRAPLDGLTFQLGLDKIHYTQIHAARDFSLGKWLLAHRLEGRVLPNLKIGISEAIVVSGGFRMRFVHLIPAFPYYLIQHLTIKGDREQDRWTNALLSVDASVNLGDDILAYTELMADDFPWALSAKGRIPYMVGGLVGISLLKPLSSSVAKHSGPTQPGNLKGQSRRENDKPETYCRLSTEYVRINNYVYSHKNPDNAYLTKDGKLIGHPLGPDADGIYMVLTFASQKQIGPFGRGQATLCFGYERHGEGAVGQPWHPADGTKHEFLSGIVETRKVLKLSGYTDVLTAGVACSQNTEIQLEHENSYMWNEIRPNITLELSLKAENIENAGHIRGTQAMERCITITLRLHYDPTAPVFNPACP